MSVFLAGGIAGCDDWQTDMVALLQRQCPSIQLFNPRNPFYDASNPDALRRQIEWEHERLHRSDAIAFWFPAETLCPITLYELGTWTQRLALDTTNTAPAIFIGCHPDYGRFEDVQIQTQLAAGVKIPPVVTSLQELADKVTAWYKAKRPVAFQ